MFRYPSVLRTLGAEWEAKSPFEIGTELFRRVLAHPEGVEIARADAERNLEDNLGYEDGRVRLVPEPMVPEIGACRGDPAGHGSRVSARARRGSPHALDGEHDPARSDLAEREGPALRAELVAGRRAKTRRQATATASASRPAGARSTMPAQRRSEAPARARLDAERVRQWSGARMAGWNRSARIRTRSRTSPTGTRSPGSRTTATCSVASRRRPRKSAARRRRRRGGGSPSRARAACHPSAGGARAVRTSARAPRTRPA